MTIFAAPRARDRHVSGGSEAVGGRGAAQGRGVRQVSRGSRTFPAGRANLAAQGALALQHAGRQPRLRHRHRPSRGSRRA